MEVESNSQTLNSTRFALRQSSGSWQDLLRSATRDVKGKLLTVILGLEIRAKPKLKETNKQITGGHIFVAVLQHLGEIDAMRFAAFLNVTLAI